MKKSLLPLLAAALAFSASAAEPLVKLFQKAIQACNDCRYEQAEQIYAQIIRQYPETDQMPTVMLNMGVMQLYGGKPEQALVTINRADSLRPGDPLILEHRGVLKYEMGDMEGAQADFGRVIELCDTNSRILFLHGSNALNAGDTLTAGRDFARLLRLKPDDINTHRAMAAYLTKVKDYAGSLGHYDAIIAQAPDVESYLGRAANYMMIDSLDRADADIAQALLLGPDDGEAYYMRAGLKKMRYDIEGAKTDGRRAVELGVSPGRVQAMLGALPMDSKAQ